MSSWRNCEPAKLDLARALADLAPNSVIDFDSGGIEIVIIDAKGTEYRRVVTVADPFLRLGTWVLIVPLLAGMWWGHVNPILPEFGTVALMALIFGGLGVLCVLALVSAFHSRLTHTLKRAKSATVREDIILELVSLYWALRYTRPLGSVIVNPFVSWSNEDNNLDIRTLLPIQRAMEWLSMHQSLTWYDRSDIEKHLLVVEESLDLVNDVWHRWIRLPLYVHLGAFIFGLVFTTWSLLVPILVRF